MAKRETDHVHCRQGLSPDSVNIGEGVGSGNLPVGVGIIDNRGKEVERLDQYLPVSQTVEPGISKRNILREQVRVVKFWYLPQDLGQGLRTYLGSSTGGSGQTGQARRLAVHNFTQ